MVHDTPPYGHAPTYQISLIYLERHKYYGPDKKILFKTIIWPWGQRSRSHEGHYGMRHTTLWSCTHIPNIIDLSGKKKKLWSGQASLRRSRRSGSGRKKIRLKQYVSLRSKGRHNKKDTVPNKLIKYRDIGFKCMYIWTDTIIEIIKGYSKEVNKGNNKITELRTILQRGSQNS